MDRCILTLVLLILIASGTLYIITHKKNTLEPFSSSCLRGCESATAITDKCRFLPQPNGKNIYSCPQECHALNIMRRRDTCSYDSDCKNCNKTTLYPNGRPTNPNGPPAGPPSRVPATNMVPSSPSPYYNFSTGKVNKNSSLCPASTIVIFNS